MFRRNLFDGCVGSQSYRNDRTFFTHFLVCGIFFFFWKILLLGSKIYIKKNLKEKFLWGGGGGRGFMNPLINPPSMSSRFFFSRKLFASHRKAETVSGKKKKCKKKKFSIENDGGLKVCVTWEGLDDGAPHFKRRENLSSTALPLHSQKYLPFPVRHTSAHYQNPTDSTSKTLSSFQ